jgi:hypothetical protein
MKLKILVLALGLVLVCRERAPAEQLNRGEKLRERSKVDTKWEKKADANKDGRVDKTEANRWKKTHPKVNNSVEMKYDANGDGYLQPQESREMLKDKQALVNTKGKARVDSAVEAEYDMNKDGVIDANEAGALKEALK